jgi:hypothetical protein
MIAIGIALWFVTVLLNRASGRTQAAHDQR